VSVELFVTQDKEQQASFFSLNSTDAKKLSLVQDGNSLVIENSLAKQSEQRLVWQDFFTTEKPVHLVLTIKKGQVELFKNGTSVVQKDIDLNFSKTLITEMVLGDKEGMWSGSIAHVAIYNQPIGREEIQQNSRYCFHKNDRVKSVDTLVIDAEISETSEIPAPDSIGAYRRALVINSYLVKKVVDGQYDEEKIVVAEWAVLDRKVVKSYDGNDGVGRLILEKFDDHPELEGERQMMDIFEPDLTMYYRLN
jgi:hypothetical protein